MIEPHLFMFVFQNYIYKYTQHRTTGGSWSITTAVVKICHRHSPTAQMYQSQSLSGNRRSVAQGALSCFMVLEMDTLLLFFSHSLWLLLCSLPSPLAERLNVLRRQRSAILLFLDHSCFIYAALWYSRILILE